MYYVVNIIDDLLRVQGWALEPGRSVRRILQLIILLTTFGVIYGAFMGSYPGPSGPRITQMLYSGIKVPLLLLATFTLSMPSFFVLNTLLGLRQDFAQSLRALLATQAGLTIILASFAPFTAFWYVSVDNYNAAILINAFLFGAASISAQILLHRFYQPLIKRNPRHRLLRRFWLIIYAFVGIQMGWVLRPFIGNPDSPTHFFRQEAWGNAYEKIFSIICNLIGNF